MNSHTQTPRTSVPWNKSRLSAPLDASIDRLCGFSPQMALLHGCARLAPRAAQREGGKNSPSQLDEVNLKPGCITADIAVAFIRHVFQ